MRAKNVAMTVARLNVAPSVSPTTIGDIVESVLVLTQFEHQMIS